MKCFFAKEVIMILTVTLNPAIDKILIIDAFKVHRLHRLQPGELSMISPGGKGVNIAQLLNNLGNKVIASGFAGGHSGHMLCEAIRQAGITTNFIFTQGATRTNISILDRQNDTLTEINDFGHEIPDEDILFFVENYERLLDRVSLVVIAGSLPWGVSPDVYKTLIEKANLQKKKVILHTVPKYIPVLMQAQPFLINPDMRSDHSLLGDEVDGISDFLRVGKTILAQSPATEFVIFTHRLENVVAITRFKAYVLRPQNLSIVNMLGYGDAYLGGFAHAYRKGRDVREVLLYASAAGLTNVECVYKEIDDVRKISDNLSRITIEEIEVTDSR